jgi:hypothetical protein
LRPFSRTRIDIDSLLDCVVLIILDGATEAMLTTLFSGAAFGAAMLAAGFHHPSVVISQLRFDNFHMIETFLTATATSA